MIIDWLRDSEKVTSLVNPFDRNLRFYLRLNPKDKSNQDLAFPKNQDHALFQQLLTTLEDIKYNFGISKTIFQ